MPDDPCVALVAEQQNLLDQQEAAAIVLEAAQLVADNISYLLMINAMNLAENGCNTGGGMMMVASAADARQKAKLTAANFNKHAVASKVIRQLIQQVQSADKNVVAK